MKNIRDILKKKAASGAGGKKKELDEKTVARVFLEVARGEIENLADADIREVKMKDKTLYIKTAHPVVSSELFLRRKKILGKLNEIAGRAVIEKMAI